MTIVRRICKGLISTSKGFRTDARTSGSGISAAHKGPAVVLLRPWVWRWLWALEIIARTDSSSNGASLTTRRIPGAMSKRGSVFQDVLGDCREVVLLMLVIRSTCKGLINIRENLKYMHSLTRHPDHFWRMNLAIVPSVDWMHGSCRFSKINSIHHEINESLLS